MIYLDYASATPVDKDVLDCYVNITNNYYGNPNSNHDMGKMAKKIIDDANKKIANILKVNPDEIIYTSGATESNNLAILGASYRYKNFGNHILVSSLEHNSVMSSCLRLQEEGFEVEIIPVNKDGIVDIDVLKSMIRPTTILVSVTSVDSELGIKQPIEEIGNFLKNYDHIVFHTDASQAIGKINIDIQNADLVTIAPHKFYGLMGISILVKRNNIELKPQILGGKSTTVYRSGTPNTNLIASTAVAIEKAYKNFSFPAKVKLENMQLSTMQDMLEENLAIGSMESVNGVLTKIDDRKGEPNERYFLSEKLEKYVLSPGTKNFMHYDAKTDLPIARALVKNMGNTYRASVNNYVHTHGRIRHLTMREVHRLMGYPDSYKIVVSKAQAYKQAGNSIVVDVMMSIIKQIFKAMNWQDGKNKKY